MLIRKYKLFVIFSFVLATLLMINVAALARSGGGGGSRGSGHSGASISSRSGSDHAGSRSRRSSHSSRSSYDSRRGSGDSRRSYSHPRGSNVRRPNVPFAPTMSPNAWRFTDTSTFGTRHYRPPAVSSNPRLRNDNPKYPYYTGYSDRYNNRDGNYNRNNKYPYSSYYRGNYSRYGDNNRYYSYNRQGYDKFNHRYYDKDNYYRRGSYYRYGYGSYRYGGYRGYRPYYYGYGYGASYFWPYYSNYWSNYYGLGYSNYNDSAYGNVYSYSNAPAYDSTEYRPVHYPRRYIFVSLNGYWPGYNYYRYYDYGTYPYFWYIPDNSNQSSSMNAEYSNANQAYTYKGSDYDYRSFGNVTEPAKQSSADKYFDQGVKLFAAQNYSKASDYFFQAKALAPSDVILPFAYVQSLFAEGKYADAARNLRQIIEQQPTGSEWAFYPRGLYTDNEILMKQIAKLLEQTGTNSDLQLLAGYQLLGIHQFDSALNYLSMAQAGDTNNQTAAGKLIFILENLKANYQK
ncbi:MAG: hypothetical protein A2Y12_12530 [Planctomycetes bacterium GWF2_42_9]|nr:MAG: hypothetical protein A2Y12_12530 [Planctomycetes bacterium GWF2_42_9]